MTIFPLERDLAARVWNAGRHMDSKRFSVRAVESGAHVGRELPNPPPPVESHSMGKHITPLISSISAQRDVEAEK